MQANINSENIKEIVSDLLKSILVQSKKLKEILNLSIQNILAKIDLDEIKPDTNEQNLFLQFKTYLHQQNDQLLELLKQQQQANKQKELLNKLEEFTIGLKKEYLDEQQKIDLINCLEFIENQEFLKISAGIEQIISSLYLQLSIQPKLQKVPSLDVSQGFTDEEFDKLSKFLFSKIQERYQQYNKSQQQQQQSDQDEDVIFVTAEEMEKYESVTTSQQKKDYEQIVQTSQNEQQEMEIIDKDSDYESVESDDDQLLEVNENAVETSNCQLQAHSKYALCVRSIGNMLITGGGDDAITISQLNENEQKISLSVSQKIQDYHEDSIDKLSINHSNKLLCSLGLDNKLQLFSIEKNFSYLTQIAKEFEVLSFEWHHKADAILVGAKDGILGLFSGKSGELLQGASLMVTGDQEDIEIVSISKGAGKLACSLGNEAKGIKCWSLKESRLIAGLNIGMEQKFHKEGANITKIQWMGEEEGVVTGGSDGVICLIIVSENLKHLKIAQQIKVSQGEIECLVNTQKDELLVGDSEGWVFGLWMAKGIIRFQIQVSQGPILELRFREKIICGRTAKGEIFGEEYSAFLQGQLKSKFENKYQVHGVEVAEISEQKFLVGVCDDGFIKIWKI